MKENPWEAKIPDGKATPSWWDRYYESDDHSYIMNTLHTGKHLQISLSRDEFVEAKKWIKNNKIALISWQKYDHDKKSKWWYVFRFRDEESAMAFKLWYI